MSEREGPIIEHDGKGYPRSIVNAEYKKGARRIVCWLSGDGRRETPWEQANPERRDPGHPGWAWGRSWTGKIKCSDPTYKRIIKYQFIYPGKAEKSEQVEMLREIATGRRQPSEVDA